MSTEREAKHGIPISVDVETIMMKWRTAEGSAERLFRFLETHRVEAGHDGFHMFYLSDTGGTKQIIVSCNQCGKEIARTRNPLPYQIASVTTKIWNQMVREAKIELKAKQKAALRSKGALRGKVRCFSRTLRSFRRE